MLFLLHAFITAVSLHNIRKLIFRPVIWPLMHISTLIDYIGFYAVSAMFQPYNGGDYLDGDHL